MKLNITREWLERKLKEASDNQVAAGRGDDQALKNLQRDVERRTVSPTALHPASTHLGMVVRFVREQRGWTRTELAHIAAMEEVEIETIETSESYEPTPRAVAYLAEALGLSKERLKELVGFSTPGSVEAANGDRMRFAARSKNLRSLSDDHYEALRALVSVLLDKRKDP